MLNRRARKSAGHQPATSLNTPKIDTRSTTSPLVSLGHTIIPRSARRKGEVERVGERAAVVAGSSAQLSPAYCKGIVRKHTTLAPALEGASTTAERRSAKLKLPSPPSSPPSDIENIQIGQQQARVPRPSVRFGDPSIPRQPLREMHNMPRSALKSSLPSFTPIPASLRPSIPPQPLSIPFSRSESSASDFTGEQASSSDQDYEDEGSGHAWYSGGSSNGGRKPTSPAAWMSSAWRTFGEGPRSFRAEGSPASSQDLSEVSLRSDSWEKELIEDYGRLGDEKGE